MYEWTDSAPLAPVFCFIDMPTLRVSAMFVLVELARSSFVLKRTLKNWTFKALSNLFFPFLLQLTPSAEKEHVSDEAKVNQAKQLCQGQTGQSLDQEGHYELLGRASDWYVLLASPKLDYWPEDVTWQSRQLGRGPTASDWCHCCWLLPRISAVRQVYIHCKSAPWWIVREESVGHHVPILLHLCLYVAEGSHYAACAYSTCKIRWSKSQKVSEVCRARLGLYLLYDKFHMRHCK